MDLTMTPEEWECYKQNREANRGTKYGTGNGASIINEPMRPDTKQDVFDWLVENEGESVKNERVKIMEICAGV